MSVVSDRGAIRGVLSNRPIVGLLTDFGLVDDAVGICKGMILGIAPNARIIDVTHDVTPFDIYEASLYIRDSFRYFPTSTVFACVTFPHTGVQDNAIGIRTPQGHVYFSPNNGLLSTVVREAGVAEVYQVAAEQVRRPVVDPTFFGRDIVMSAAAHYANGVPLHEVGPRLRVEDVVLLDEAVPRVEDEWIVGEVATLDKNFGNVWTTVTHDFLIEHGVDFGTDVVLEVGPAAVTGPLSPTFGTTGVGEPVIYIASRGQLAVALNQGDFAAAHSVVRGHPVRLRKQ